LSAREVAFEKAPTRVEIKNAPRTLRDAEESGGRERWLRDLRAGGAGGQKHGGKGE
jgi:hypothetical protein